jgi:dolichyl-phosphate-mannose--protein O-mannosyl transferase
MFGSTAVSVCGTILFAFDFMHFTQTRIATIDTYAVFFILLMYLFMWRFVSGGKLRDLALSGLFFGLGAASKWTGIYAGAGLGVIWLAYWFTKRKEERVWRDKVDGCLEQGCVGPFGCAWFGLGVSCLGLLFVVPNWMI